MTAGAAHDSHETISFLRKQVTSAPHAILVLG